MKIKASVKITEKSYEELVERIITNYSQRASLFKLFIHLLDGIAGVSGKDPAYPANRIRLAMRSICEDAVTIIDQEMAEIKKTVEFLDALQSTVVETEEVNK